ncbi:MAG TPA: DUF2071 domain-containing protein [Gaiellales bacterium]|jgi:hypothetical protein|nr:DUF2071 domain-containing protein [Gaiellales bacterium]
MGQTWEHLLFAHWSVEPDVMAHLLPRELELDVWGGRAWLAVAPFLLSGLRPRLLPAPRASHFLETNVRTYVRRRGRPGIYFFSLDATSPAAVRGARLFYRLPYHRAQGSIEINNGSVRYRINRAGTGRPVRLHAEYRGREAPHEAAPETLEHFLVERYCLYARPSAGAVLRTDIHHPPWLIATAEGQIDHEGLIPAPLEPLRGEPLLHIAAPQDTLVWAPVRA